MGDGGRSSRRLLARVASLATLATLATLAGVRGGLLEKHPVGQFDPYDFSPNLFLDPRPPFYIGVSSGDPLPDSVILWTRATPRTAGELANGTLVHWRIWSPPDSSEVAPSLQGNATGPPERDWTVKVDASPLEFTNRTYYYRFYHGHRGRDEGDLAAAEASRLGRTRTAPSEDAEGGLLSFGYTSCTHQGYHLGALAHLAYNVTLGGLVAPALRLALSAELPEPADSDALLLQSESITAMLSGGDSLYDYDFGPRNPQQSYGAAVVPEPETTLDPAFAPLSPQFDRSWYGDNVFYSFTSFPLNIDEWRWRHIMTKLDPDRRAAFAAHPWIHIADSHEGGPQGQSNASTTSLRAFEWYTPTRVRYEAHPLSGEEQIVLYRDFRFGRLAHLVVIDARGIGRQQPEDTFLGVPQRKWLVEDVFANPNNTGWRLLMTGKPITAWATKGYRALAMKIALLLTLSVLVLVACCFFARRQHFARRKKCREPTGKPAAKLLDEQEEDEEEDEEEGEEEGKAAASSRGRVASSRTAQRSLSVEGPARPVSSGNPLFAAGATAATASGTGVRGWRRLVPVPGKSDREDVRVRLVRARNGFLCCCGHLLIPGALLGVGVIAGANYGGARFLDFADNHPRNLEQPEVASSTVFGEIINWVGSPVDRAELFKDMHDAGATQDNVWLVGDNHMHQAANVRHSSQGHRIVPDAARELVAQGRNVFLDYGVLDDESDRLGAEWLPSSTGSVGAYDELFGITTNLAALNVAKKFIAAALMSFNRHWTFFDPESHGIGYVQVRSEHVTCDFFRSDIWYPFRETVLYWTGRIRRGANQWDDDFKEYTDNWKYFGEDD